MSNPKPVWQHPDLQAIWKRLYLVNMPEMYLRDEEDIRSRGTFSTGDVERDMAIQNSNVRAYRTIDAMFELWRNGVNISVVNYEDTEKIYYAIEKHLSNWYRYMQMGIAISICPFDELLELDRFANTVYDRAKYVFTPESLVPIQPAINSLGLSMNPMDFHVGKKGTIRFNHSFKTADELAAEQGISNASYAERRGYEEEILTIASRYDVPLVSAPKKEVPALNLELTFGNQK